MGTVADPGFPVGGGGVDLRHGRFPVKMYAKMKELGPIEGGMCPAVKVQVGGDAGFSLCGGQ